MRNFFLYFFFFCGLECVGHSFAYVAHLQRRVSKCSNNKIAEVIYGSSAVSQIWLWKYFCLYEELQGITHVSTVRVSFSSNA